MRAVLAVTLAVLFFPTAGLAQTKGGDITRDQYIERAVERARRAAATRFDKMDTNHDGVLTAEERRAARAQRRAAPPQ
jgi:hypothetical protein